MSRWNSNTFLSFIQRIESMIISHLHRYISSSSFCCFRASLLKIIQKGLLCGIKSSRFIWQEKKTGVWFKTFQFLKKEGPTATPHLNVECDCGPSNTSTARQRKCRPKNEQLGKTNAWSWNLKLGALLQ